MFGFVEINDIYCHRLGTFAFNRTGGTSVYALYPVSKRTYDEVTDLYARSPLSCASRASRLEPTYHPTSSKDGVLILALFDHGAHLCEDHKINLCIALPEGVVNPCISDLMALGDTDSPDPVTQGLLHSMRRAVDCLKRDEPSKRIYISAPRCMGLKNWKHLWLAETDLAQWPVANPCIAMPVKKEKTISDVIDEFTDEQKKVVYYMVGRVKTEAEEAMKLTKRPVHELIKKVVFSGPVTIVYWTDGTMTKVRRAEGESDDKEKAIGMALMKHLTGEKASYISHLGKIIESATVVKPNPRSKKDDGGSGDDT